MGERHQPEKVIFAVTAKRLQTAGIVLVGSLVGLALFWAGRPFLPDIDVLSGSGTEPDSVKWYDAPRFDVSVANRPYLGSRDAPVTIVEFTDYGCPYCRRHALEVFPALSDSLSHAIAYVVRHFPIPALTPNAIDAAIAAECAFRSGVFWEYKRALQEEPESFQKERLRFHAVGVGIDPSDFDSCVREESVRDIVERDILDGWDYGVTGTPTFFINGRRFQGARPLEELLEYVRLASLEVHDSGSPPPR